MAEKILITEGEMARLNQPIALFTQTKEEPVQELKKEPTQPAKTEAQATPTQTEEAPKKQAAMFKEPAFVPAPPCKKKESKRLKRKTPRLPSCQTFGQEERTGFNDR